MIAKGGSALRKPSLPIVFLAVVVFLAFRGTSDLRAEETTHTVVKGDTLWDISMKYLKTPWKWPLVWANNQDITNPHLIYPGDRVIITTEGGRTILKIIPSPERGGEEREAVFYTPREIASVKDKSVVLAPQFALYMFSPNLLKGSGEIVRKVENGELISENDHIVISSGSAFKKDQVVTIVTKIQDIVDEEGDSAGYLYRITGMARVDEVVGGLVKATVTYSLQESRIGSIIFDDIPPIKPVALDISEPSGISGVVMDHHGGVVGGATFDLVFVNAGTRQGVEKGALLSVYRKTDALGGDANRQAASFHDPIGVIVVLQSLDSSSMGLVVQSKELIEKGALVLGRK